MTLASWLRPRLWGPSSWRFFVEPEVCSIAVVIEFDVLVQESVEMRLVEDHDKIEDLSTCTPW